MVFLYRIDNDVFRLYIGNLSANQGLSVFPSDTDVSIENYGDTGPKGGDWITESDLPPIADVRELREFLASAKCNYINLEVIVGEKTIFSAYEDAECDFAFQSKSDIS